MVPAEASTGGKQKLLGISKEVGNAGEVGGFLRADDSIALRLADQRTISRNSRNAALRLSCDSTAKGSKARDSVIRARW